MKEYFKEYTVSKFEVNLYHIIPTGGIVTENFIDIIKYLLKYEDIISFVSINNNGMLTFNTKKECISFNFQNSEYFIKIDFIFNDIKHLHMLKKEYNHLELTEIFRTHILKHYRNYKIEKLII